MRSKPKRAEGAPTQAGPTAAALVKAAQDELVSGHLSAALDLYQQATIADARHAEAFRGLGLVHERLGHKAAALRALRRAVTLAPGDPKNALIHERISKLAAD